QCRTFHRPRATPRHRSRVLAHFWWPSERSCSVGRLGKAASPGPTQRADLARWKRSPERDSSSRLPLWHSPCTPGRSVTEVAQDVIDEAIPRGEADTEPKWSLKRGQEIDDTLVAIDALGTGTRYEVYRAWDRVLFCEVAAKVIRPHRVPDDRAIEGFERDTSTGYQFTQQHISRVICCRSNLQRP